MAGAPTGARGGVFEQEPVRPPDRLDLLLAEVRALRVEVAALRVEREAMPTLRRGDRAALERVLPVLAGIFGPSRFAAWEVLDRAAQADGDGANLRLVLGRGIRAPELGRLLARGAGVDVDGLRIVRDGRDGNGARWRVVTTR